MKFKFSHSELRKFLKEIGAQELIRQVRDRSCRQIEFFMKLHGKDGGLCNIAIYFSRTPNNDWEAEIPEVPPVRPVREQALSPKEIQDELDRIIFLSKEYVMQHETHDVWVQLLEEVNDYSTKGVSATDLETTRNVVYAMQNYGYGSYLIAPCLAVAYSHEGKGFLQERRFEDAVSCIQRGLYWVENLHDDPKKKLRDRASAAGTGKSKKTEPVKTKARELLHELMPEGGWDSKADAIKKVDAELMANHVGLIEDAGLKSENLATRIAEWMRKSPEWFGFNSKLKK